MITHTTDVVVIGGGINGASCAYHLASRGLSTAVLERETAPAMGSTGKSAAGVRVQFTTAANIRLSLYSLPVYREFAERHGHGVVGSGGAGRHRRVGIARVARAQAQVRLGARGQRHGGGEQHQEAAGGAHPRKLSPDRGGASRA